MLELASWLPQAQAIAEGRKQRVAHGCGSGRTLLVENKQDCWSAWCHRCNDKGWHPKPQPSLAERLERIKAKAQTEAAMVASIRPPQPANFDPSTWPLEARVWLYKAGLSNDRIKSLGIYHHEPSGRVVLPIIENDRLLYWQARGFDRKSAKYLNPPVPEKPAFKAGDGPVLVLTEDILSAARVGEVTEAWCLMGTSITDKMLTAILARRKRVLVWLDPDGAGVKGRRKFVPRLRAYGVDATAITSDKDPKYHSKEEIAHILGFDALETASQA